LNYNSLNQVPLFILNDIDLSKTNKKGIVNSIKDNIVVKLELDHTIEYLFNSAGNNR